MNRNVNTKTGLAYRATKAYPAEFGARHPVVLRRGNSLDMFFKHLDARWQKVVPDLAEPVYLPEKDDFEDSLTRRYALYDSAEKVGMTVLEKRIVRNFGKKNRLYWTPNDIGRATVQIRDEIGRLDIANEPLIPLTLTTAIRTGNPGDNSRRLAIVADQQSATAELLVREHEIIVESLRGPLRKFSDPYEDYVPKLTVGRIDRSVDNARVDTCIARLQSLLPITVELQPLIYFAHQEIK